MWTAPGMRPSSHSSRSRTSTTSGAFGGAVEELAGAGRVHLVDLALHLGQ